MDTQTEAQRQKALLDAGLTPTQQAGVTAGTGYSINSSVLQPQPEIKLPTPPQDTTNYSGMISGGQATIDQYNKDVQKGIDDALKAQQGANPSLIDQYLKSSTAPTELTGQYQTAVAGLAPQEQAVATENVALKSAQAKLRDVNARLAGINAEAQAIPIRLQEEATGRGITAGGLAPIQAGELRKVALRALPLQAEAIAAQAEVQTAQGNVELAQNTLKLAQDKLNTAFQLYTKDAENKYNYQKDLRDKVYAYATEKEKQKLDALQKQDDRDFQFMRDQIKNASDIAQEAMKNGQASLAAQITALDPNSKSYVTDLAELQGQIIPKTETDIIKLDSGETVMIDKKTGNIIKSIGGAKGMGGSGATGLTPEQQKDPFISKLLSSAGGKPITDTFAQQLNKGLAVLGQIGGLQTNIKETNTGPIVGAFRGANPWDTNAQTIKAQLNAIVPNLARGVYGEVGVLTDNDIKQYSKTLPNLKSPDDIRNAVLGITVDLIGKSVKRTLEINAANQKDVSGFVDLYTEMQNTRDSIFSQIPGYKGETKSLKDLGITKDEESLFDSTIGTAETTDAGLGGFFSNIWKGLTGK